MITAIDYSGGDKPCVLGITELKNCKIVNIGLSIKTTDVEQNEEYPEGKQYEYVSISGTMESVSARDILSDICSLGYFESVDMNFITALAKRFNVSVEDMLSIVKEMKRESITFYDNSSAVNSFSFGGADYWIDKATRVGLVNSTTILKNAGKENTTLWLGSTNVTLPCDNVLQMLSAIEMYALECYNVTASHKNDIDGLDSIDAILAYDITADYPSKLVLG